MEMSDVQFKPNGNRWHVLLATWLGELFDGMDASIFVLVLFPALSELLQTQSHAAVGATGSIMLSLFMVGWAVGAFFFGIVADHIGRSRTLLITIWLYAICTGLCALCQSWMELAACRFLVGCGIGGEISIGAVMLAESWHGRARVHALSALATSFGAGYLIAALLNYVLCPLGWRWLFVAGVAPALITIYVRAKLKEPDSFVALQNKKDKLKGKSAHELSKEEKEMLIHPLVKLFRKEHLISILTVIGLASTAIVGYWAVLSWIPAWVNQLTGTQAVMERSQTAIVMNIGAIIASALGGLAVEKFGRRNSFRICFVGALISCLAMFLGVKSFGIFLLTSVFFVGAFATMPFVLLFIYVPELFSAEIRGTAFGFSVQVGRVFAACAALAGGQVIQNFGGSYACAGVSVSLFYLLGIACTFFMPQTDSDSQTALDRDLVALVRSRTLDASQPV